MEFGRLNLIGEFDAGGLPGGGGPGQVNGFTLFLLLLRLRLKYFYVTYHGNFQEAGHKINSSTCTRKGGSLVFNTLNKDNYLIRYLL